MGADIFDQVASGNVPTADEIKSAKNAGIPTTESAEQRTINFTLDSQERKAPPPPKNDG